ncbi:MAG: adenylyl-sulfate kinase [Rickettsiales bacterium]|nr:adenylyl-sulfate kinase [Pseudomonadota bacterium]MDA0965601.1 adenylyl-sulfate kinase [Pseudomonadota bacterium]MDG4542925.1 adenylyl-sulfate kinase [Rickettsiales bacterium]MDG4544627.1 adenylyl-sulfate kinase [Rickettsiales bacterium]MDG4546749.1 adenylyl-sulfate kinase [Rickettsiales bacterium]
MKAIQEVPAMDNASSKEQMKIVIVGHVDHGKSTLVGRLFHDTDSLPDGKFEQIQTMCKRRGMQFEWSFLMDALQSERDQEITIDTSQIWFKTAKRNYVIIDAPGHKEFLKNMISGAAMSEAALLIIDANEGVQEQSKRHGYLLHLLGVRQITVAVNKMDLVGYSEKKFQQIEKEYRAYLKSIGVTPTDIVPISAREGDNIAKGSDDMPWYKGPTVVEALDNFKRKPELHDLPLRFPIQDVYRFDEHKRIFAGRVETGTLKVGDKLLFSPSNKTSKVASIEFWGADEPWKEAGAGQCVGVTLEEQIFVERGEIASLTKDAPVLTNLFRAKLFWLGRNDLEVGKRYVMKINTSEYKVEVREVEKVISTDDLSHSEVLNVARNDVAEVVLQVRGLAALDEFEQNQQMGRFMLMDGYDVAGGGIISMEGFSDQRVSAKKVESKNLFEVTGSISQNARALNNGHLGGMLWFSGLSGAGKTTLAIELERRLFAKGYQVYVLDGDNIRNGLCADLDFTPEGRSENLRRVAEVAALFAKAGVIVITAFISPYSEDRRRARNALPENFHSIFIDADLKTCEGRDPKGLYKKAREGKIAHFTGVSDKFEEPDNADLIVNNGTQSVDRSVDQLEEYVEHHFVAPLRNLGKEKGEAKGEGI